MKPRTKKGPSWANEDSVPQPAAPVPPAKSTSTAPKKNSGDGENEEDVEMADADSSAPPPPSEPLSDMDWLKQRMSSNVDKVVEEKAFEQSDDEDGGREEDGKDEEAVSPVPSPRIIWFLRSWVRLIRWLWKTRNRKKQK